MKRLLALVLSLVMALSLCSPAWGAAGTISGTGTEADPYLIEDLDDLKAFRNKVNGGNNYRGQYIKLTADIDLGGEEWTPIGPENNPFQGTFDGGGHTISNLVITGSNSYVGLFGRTNSTADKPSAIKNFTLKNAKVSGSTEVGTVVGYSTNANVTYSDITVTGHIEVTGDAYVGALAGKISGDCTNLAVDVDSDSFVHSNLRYSGGVIGWTGGIQAFTNLTSNATVTGDGKNVGGLIGIVYSGSTVQNVTFNGTVKVAADCESYGAILGRWENSTAGTTLTVTNAVSNGTVTVGGTTVTDYPLVGLPYKPALETASDSGALSVDGTQLWPTPAAKIVSGGTTVNYDTLAAAITAAQAGDTITLLRDTTYTGSDRAVIDGKTLTIDLGGYTVTGEHVVINIKNGADVTLKNGTIRDTTSDACAVQVLGAKATLASDLDVISNVGAAVTIYGKDGYETVLTTYADLTTNDTNSDAAISGQGAYDGTVINVAGGSLNSANGVGIYHPQDGTLNITGGTITANTGIIMKSGTLNISGGTINATGAKVDYAYIASGYNLTGDALLVENVGYLTGESEGYEPITSISITGGTFTSANGYAVASYDAGVNAAVEAVDNFITGGTFSSDVSALAADSNTAVAKVNDAYIVGADNIKAVAASGTTVTVLQGTVTLDNGTTLDSTNGAYTVPAPTPVYPYYPTVTPTTTPSTTDKTVTSADTFDGGIALAVAVSVLSVTGSAVLLRKKED